MSSTLSMWLGILFVVLGIAAVVLQAWLWNPKYWDPVAKKSHAPPFWMGVHRAVGYGYAAIYVVMMVEMVPRLWEYQIELPARTVMHATAAISIGVILVTKIAILRFFRHFEEAMPALGLSLLVCTVVLATLSLPFALRAHGSDAAFTDENRERVRTILTRLELARDGEVRTAEELSTRDALYRGREVVMQRCSTCHDLRTVLVQPRTGSGWLSLNRRMQNKPTLGMPLTDDEVLFATAYLIAITPQLREDVRARREEELARGDAEEGLGGEAGPIEEGSSDVGPSDAGSGDAGPGDAVDAGVADAELDAGSADAELDAGTVDGGRRVRRRRDAGVDGGSPVASVGGTPVAVTVEPPRSVPDAGVPPVIAPPPERLVYSASLARQILDRRCTDCHGLSDIEAHGGDDRAGWASMLRRMIRQGAELDSEETRVLVQYLSTMYPLPN